MPPSKISVWQFQGVTLERRDNPTGQALRLPRHSHHEYQIVVSEHLATQYFYRGVNHLAGPGSLVILHPEEVHSAQGREDNSPFVPLRTMLVPSDFFHTIMTDVTAKTANPPFFAKPVVSEPQIVMRFLHLHQTLEHNSTALEKDVLLLATFAQLVAEYAATRPHIRFGGNERGSVRRVRDYLELKYAENISLAHLANIAGLSPYYLCRVFSQEIGLPPQVYQAQVRVERAKAMLAQGMPIAETALLTGFADQSHFTRQFRKSVGVTPARYVRLL